jgi:hypothetical protein
VDQVAYRDIGAQNLPSELAADYDAAQADIAEKEIRFFGLRVLLRRQNQSSPDAANATWVPLMACPTGEPDIVTLQFPQHPSTASLDQPQQFQLDCVLQGLVRGWFSTLLFSVRIFFAARFVGPR